MKPVESLRDPRLLPANTIGAVDWETQRVCVRVADYAASALNGDAPAYWFSADADLFGVDPWALVEGIDPHIDGRAFDVWFSTGQCKTVGADAVIYLAAKHADALAPSSP